MLFCLRLQNPQKFAHVRSGYSREEMQEKCEKAGLKFANHTGYLKLFHSLSVKIENLLVLNNMKIIYMMIFPLLRLISLLDVFIPTSLYFKENIFIVEK